MKFNRVIMHFHPSRPDRLLGFNQSGELWAVVGNIEFAKTRPLDGWVRLYGDDSATITTIENNEIGTIKVRKGFSVQKSIIETVVEERIFVAYYTVMIAAQQFFNGIDLQNIDIPFGVVTLENLDGYSDEYKQICIDNGVEYWNK